jgi:excisionase family DNA binding protein
MKRITTRIAAKTTGISRATLQAWISTGTIRAPKLQIVDGVAVRVWKDTDLARLRAVKEKVYCKGRGPQGRSKS